MMATQNACESPLSATWAQKHSLRRRVPKAKRASPVALFLKGGASKLDAKLAKALKRPLEVDAPLLSTNKNGMLTAESKKESRDAAFKAARFQFMKENHMESNCMWTSDINDLIRDGSNPSINSRVPNAQTGVEAQKALSDAESGVGQQVVYEDQRCVVFAAYGKLVSAVHLICVPKNTYIYNAVTLDAVKDLGLVRHMRDVLKEAVFEIVTSKKARENYMEILKTGMNRLSSTNETRIIQPWMGQDTGKMSSEDKEQFLKQMRDRMTKFARLGSLRSNISAAVKVHPKADLGVFHMHGYIASEDLVTENGRQMINDLTAVESIIKVLVEEKKLRLAENLL